MTRFVAFLRGVNPANAPSAELKRAFEVAGFKGAKTLLSSGNVAFDAPDTTEATLETRIEAALQKALGRGFFPIVRTTAALRALVASDPYAGFVLPPQVKRVVSFLRAPREPKIALPLVSGEARVLCLRGREAFSAYVPDAKGPVFMQLIEKAFGAEVTTRTWETVRKCAVA